MTDQLENSSPPSKPWMTEVVYLLRSLSCWAVVCTRWPSVLVDPPYSLTLCALSQGVIARRRRGPDSSSPAVPLPSNRFLLRNQVITVFSILNPSYMIILISFADRAGSNDQLSISKYRGTTRYRYQTLKVSKYRLTIGWFVYNVIPGYRG